MADVLGYLGGYEPLIIFLACLGAFAMAGFGLNQFFQWQTIRMAADKLALSVPAIGLKLDTTKKPAKLEGIKLGITAISHATFPLEIRLTKLETQIGDKVPIEAFKEHRVTAAAKAITQFHGALIDLSKEQLKNALLRGTIRGAVSYGRPGKLRYQAEQTLWLLLKFDRNGQLLTPEVSNTELFK